MTNSKYLKPCYRCGGTMTLQKAVPNNGVLYDLTGAEAPKRTWGQASLKQKQVLYVCESCGAQAEQPVDEIIKQKNKIKLRIYLVFGIVVVIVGLWLLLR